MKILNEQAYLSFIERTRDKLNYSDKAEVSVRELEIITGLSSECGEVLGVLSKACRGKYNDSIEGVEQFVNDMRNELGDLFYYFMLIADECGLTLQEIIDGNVQKLSARYNL